MHQCQFGRRLAVSGEGRDMCHTTTIFLYSRFLQWFVSSFIMSLLRLSWGQNQVIYPVLVLFSTVTVCSTTAIPQYSPVDSDKFEMWYETMETVSKGSWQLKVWYERSESGQRRKNKDRLSSSQDWVETGKKQTNKQSSAPVNKGAQQWRDVGLRPKNKLWTLLRLKRH